MHGIFGPDFVFKKNVFEESLKLNLKNKHKKEIISIIGVKGCGKSSLINLLKNNNHLNKLWRLSKKLYISVDAVK